MVLALLWGSLSQGATFSSDVQHAQFLLNKMGYKAGTEDGLYGKDTETALIEFHTRNQKVYDGTFSSNEIMLLNDAYANLTENKTLEIKGELILFVSLFVFIVLILKKKKHRRNPRFTQQPVKNSFSRNPDRKKLKPMVRPASDRPITGYAHVIDGDTIVISGIKVRLAGIDAPELDRPWGQKSKWTMVDITKGKKVTARPTGESSYDRIVAICYVDGSIDIGAELIKRGMALDIPLYTDGKYSHLETPEARKRLKRTPYKKMSL